MSPDQDEVRALLIETRKYAIRRGSVINQCVPWQRLLDLHDIGVDDVADAEWLRAYRQKQAAAQPRPEKYT